MVEWISDWLKPIILLVLMASFIDLILPNQSLDRYVKLVMGLLIILAILSPIFRFLSDDLDVSRWTWKSDASVEMATDSMASLQEINTKSQTASREQQTLLRTQVDKTLQQEIARDVAKRFPVKVMEAELEIAWGEEGQPAELESVTLYLLPLTETTLTDESGAEENKIEPIQPVEEIAPIAPITGEKRSETAAEPVLQQELSTDQKALIKQIENHLDQEWGIKPKGTNVVFASKW
ncbi:stage III sporulation protein AF [Mechercharimyces sp. CAU 1602]|uniref:stage III sporulation protein AF n=1 Tax=Mechercharimyces sp. CAU 1602 TaxID=2973933 RepID=UPI0021613B24|nr:stage III sporulation protein AF [Mechercharimyces sp. CAU 1602]MCS1350776.1 stage III sporulation protein AF [Mechercharimyces sp. CAU 1602]